MSNAPKRPKDHQKKGAADRLRAEAKAQAAGVVARQITLSGRRGDVTVTVLEDPMEWGIDATELIGVWQTRDPQQGGITAVEMRRFLAAIVSVADADRIGAIEPTVASLSAAADAILSPLGADEPEDLSLGESQAS